MNKTKHIHFHNFELKTNFPAKLYDYFPTVYTLRVVMRIIGQNKISCREIY